MPSSIFQLYENNPWWTNPKSIESDQSIQEFEKSTVKWVPGLQRYMPLDSEDYVFYSIRGPRQVGKTTFIKNMIRELLVKGVDSQKIFFWPCDEIRDERNLTKMVESYLSFTRQSAKDRLYIFLDEITSVRSWENSIKYLHDTGKLRNTTLILNGSHAMGIQRGFGELAGRTGKGNTDPHKMFVPMKFSEFVKCTDPANWSIVVKNGLEKGDDRRRMLLNLMLKKTDKIPYSLTVAAKDFNLDLDRYMLAGGVPRSVNDLFGTGRITSLTFDTYIEALRGDLAHWDRDNWKAHELLARLVKCMGCTVSWNNIAGEIGVTQPTIKDYVETLERCFVLTYLHRTIDLVSPESKSMKGKKVYFEDPFLFHAIRHWATSSKGADPFQYAVDYLSEPTNVGYIVENIVANHLIRLQFNMNPSSSFQYNQNLFYALPTKRSEIDFILNTGDGPIPIEVRFQSTIYQKDWELVARIASKVGKRGILLTKEDMTIEDNYAMLPASLFLLLI